MSKSSDPVLANFLKYISKMYTANHVKVAVLAEKESVRLEYLYKTRFIKQIYEVEKNEDVGIIINRAIDLSKLSNHKIYYGLSHTIFDGFMHYVATNDIEDHIVKSYVRQWVASGRSLKEVDDNEQTPLDLALLAGQISSIAQFAKYGGIDLTQLKNGDSPLHRLVKLVNKGFTPPEAITDWCESELPTKVVSSQGMTPLRLALELGNKEAILAFAKGGLEPTILDYCAQYHRGNGIDYQNLEETILTTSEASDDSSEVPVSGDTDES